MSIRIKLILIGLAFMTIPVLAYQFINDMKQFVQKGQEQALLLEAKAVASILHERKELFSNKIGIKLNQKNSAELYAQLRGQAVLIDGKADDWVEILQNARFFGKNNQISGPPPKSNQDFSYWALFSYDKEYIYALFQVNDNELTFRDKNSLKLGQSDHLRIYLEANDKKTVKYILNAEKPGTMSAYRVKEDWQNAITGKHDSDFLAQMVPTSSGYNIELRIPIEKVMGSQKISFAINDYQGKDSKIIATIKQQKIPKLNKILLRSPLIDNILEGLDKPDGRIWVVDLYQRVRAVVGDLKTKNNIEEEKGFLDKIFFALFLDEPVYDFKDIPKNTEILTNNSIIKALKGETNTFVRRSTDNKTTILGATVPIENAGKIVGVVVIEQSNNDILSLENSAIINMMKQLSIIFIIAALTMIWFAVRLTYRINRLHQETNTAITNSGKIKENPHITIKSKDEIGKLAKSILSMLNSLGQHTKYLERMPRTLRHEILNPLSVINISLENLVNTSKQSPKELKYINSAQNGINRLGSILHSLTEASNLESAFVNEEKQSFDLRELLQEYLENYQELHKDYKFNINIGKKPVLIFGWPEAIAQMIDKILDNALDFSKKYNPIFINLKVKEKCEFYVFNQGEHIPTDIQENIFESMVSKRSDKFKQKPHLGIGLYVARVIVTSHNGSISVENINMPKGVEFKVLLPIEQDDQ